MSGTVRHRYSLPLRPTRTESRTPPISWMLNQRPTPTLQPPDVIPAQVQCMAALLAKEEKKLERVRLVLSDTGCGTYTTHE